MYVKQLQNKGVIYTTTTTTEFRIIGNSIKAAVTDLKNNSEFGGQKFVTRLSEIIKKMSVSLEEFLQKLLSILQILLM